MDLLYIKFQFQYGAIKSLKASRQVVAKKTCFNSSMVRLRVKLINICYIDGKLFQFQYGAIKRDVNKKDPNSFSVVSIPVWCD